MRAGYLVALTLALAACGRGGQEEGAGRTTTIQMGDVAEGPLTAAELGRFSALPPDMKAANLERTPAQIALGRRLYYENVLSEGHDVSCNSCHALNGYGADGRRVSFGSVGHAGNRNAPTVYHAGGHVAQFWDGRAATLEEQAKGPILNPAEMAMPDTAAVLAHMRGSAEYRRLFAAAFPRDRDPITYDNLARAIGAFERGLVTPSPWDRYLEGEAGALTPEQASGAAVFTRVGCASCHSGTYVGGQSFMKVGLVRPWPTASDSGRVKVTGDPADLFVFKVPSLRNVEQTGPWFHDGSVASLDEAIRLMGRHQLGVELDSAKVQGIRAFLTALTGTLPSEYIGEPPKPAQGR